MKMTYEPTEDRFTASAGLGGLVDLFLQSPQSAEMRKCLPPRSSNASYDTMHLALTFMAGFWYGHDSIDDLDEFEEDPSVEDKLGGLPSPRAAGDYLRDFTADHLRAMNEFITRQALSGRRQLKASEVITLDIDSTAHVQSGDKMEGLAYNYKDEWCLDSLAVFDELGLGYGMELRPGNTFSGNGAPAMISRVLTQLPKIQGKHRVRADSAFCNEEFIRTCLLHSTEFTITAHDNMNWTDVAAKTTEWTPWVYSKEEQEEAQKKGKRLPAIETAHYNYQPGWAENLRFPVVIKRTWVSNDTSTKRQFSLFAPEAESSGNWKYYAVMTNMSMHLHSDQAVLEHHAKRGNAENFIKETKYGYDLKHFPCLKLSANHAYGQLAQVSHNFMRTLALLVNPDKPNYAKKLRRKFVFIPGRLVKHARSLVMKIPVRYYEEVMRLHKAWAATLPTALAPG